MQSDNKKKWVEARECFLDLADLDPLDREARLKEIGARDPELVATVLRLLEQDPGKDSSQESSARPSPDGAEPSGGRVFGPYRSVRLLAVGGMGEVHLARRTDGEYEREVAIKSLRPGREAEQLVQRFLRERQFLARLDHKYITQLLDGGTTDEGHPYLVLEYVEGSHIDQHCRALGLDVSERVTLFLRVLEAVGHAHESGIVHRDLKPSNILVRHDGSPRLLDFGISLGAPEQDPKLGDVHLTGTGQRLFTPEFASPEQIRGETATTASDIFSLGVVLYDLLTDVGPWDGSGSLHELERRVLEQKPAWPSVVARGTGRLRVSADLSTIIMACLEKEPSQRLPSVQALAEELQRTLDGFPIRTRPTRAPTRALRFAKRNPWQTLAGVTCAVALLAGGFAWRYYATSVDQQELLLSDLEQRLEYASNLGDQDRFPEAIPELLELRTRLEGAENSEGLGALELRVASDLAIAYLRTGDPQAGLAEAEKGLAHGDLGAPESHGAHLALLLSACTACNWLLDAERAQDFAERSHGLAQAEFEPGHPKRIEAYQAFAGMTAGKRGLSERIEVLGRGVREAREYGADKDPALADCLMFYGMLLTEAGDYGKAVAALDETLEVVRWSYGEGHAQVALARSARGNSLRLKGDWDRALEDLLAASAAFEEREQGPYLAPTLQHLGMLRLAMGRFEPALQDFASAQGLFAELYGAETPICSYLEAQQAQCLLGMEQLEEARASFESAFAADPGVGFQGWIIEIELRSTFGDLLLTLGDRAAAEAQFERVYRVREVEFGLEDPRTAEALQRLEESRR